MHHLPPETWGVENNAEAILRKGSLLAAVPVSLPSGHAALPAWLWCMIPGINGALHFVVNRTRTSLALEINRKKSLHAQSFAHDVIPQREP